MYLLCSCWPLQKKDIPYFKEVIVMASTCDACGYRNSEVCMYFSSLILCRSTFAECFFICLCYNPHIMMSMQLKPGGSISEKAKRTTVIIKNVKDLSRDVIKVCFHFLWTLHNLILRLFSWFISNIHCYLERHSVWNRERKREWEQGTQLRLTLERLGNTLCIKKIFESK